MVYVHNVCMCTSCVYVHKDSTPDTFLLVLLIGNLSLALDGNLDKAVVQYS